MEQKLYIVTNIMNFNILFVVGMLVTIVIMKEKGFIKSPPNKLGFTDRKSVV